ncbi:MAG: hypothetical protein ACRYHQ_40330 [Janthinobacterium lividum]
MRRLTDALAVRSSGMRGRVHDDRVRLERRIGYRNSFQPQLVGRMRDCQGGTCFDVSVGMHPAVWIFLAFWVLMLGPLAFSIDAQAVVELLRHGTTDAGVIGLAITGMLLFAVVLTFGGRWLARSEEAELLGFLRTVALAGPRPG